MTPTQLKQFLQDNINQISETRCTDTMSTRSTWAMAQITLAYCLELISLQEHDRMVYDVRQMRKLMKAKT